MRKRQIIETIVKMQNIEVENIANLKASLKRDVSCDDFAASIMRCVDIRNVMHDCEVRAQVLEKLFKRITDGTQQEG